MFREADASCRSGELAAAMWGVVPNAICGDYPVLITAQGVLVHECEVAPYRYRYVRRSLDYCTVDL